MTRFIRSSTAARSTVLALLCLHLLAVMALAASPRLHHWVHPGDDDHDHDCAVVAFLHGGNDSAPLPVTVPVCPSGWAECILVSLTPERVATVFETNHVLEHAPPGCFCP